MYKYVPVSDAKKRDQIARLERENEKLRADLEYVSMMADIELEEEAEQDEPLEEI